MSTFLASNPTKRELQLRVQEHGVLEQLRVIEAAQSSRAHPVGSADVLTRHQFLRQLRRERLRSDRSKAPLSIALFTCSGGDGVVSELLELALERKRETDILGCLGDDLVAVLLPDTSKEGAERLTAKLLDDAGALPVSATTRTYPDHLFDAIAVDEPTPSDLYPFEVAEASTYEYLRRLGKRGLDIVGAATGLVILSPLLALIAVAVAMSSPGPIIFRQIRLGKGGNPFVFYKFRSMRCNADDRIHREYVANLIQGNLAGANQGDADKPLYKLKADPRITPIGRVLRKTSLDELPQLFNVLRGDMSLVGPRPPVPYEVERYQAWHLRRILEVKPGITGLWQVEGRSRTSFDDMVRLDLRYVRRWSLVLDVKILFRTAKVVLVGDGAS